eukprot:3770343-Prymnesium_polylepis.2
MTPRVTACAFGRFGRRAVPRLLGAPRRPLAQHARRRAALPDGRPIGREQGGVAGLAERSAQWEYSSSSSGSGSSSIGIPTALP